MKVQNVNNILTLLNIFDLVDPFERVSGTLQGTSDNIWDPIMLSLIWLRFQLVSLASMAFFSLTLSLWLTKIISSFSNKLMSCQCRPYTYTSSQMPFCCFQVTLWQQTLLLPCPGPPKASIPIHTQLLELLADNSTAALFLP